MSYRERVNNKWLLPFGDEAMHRKRVYHAHESSRSLVEL